MKESTRNRLIELATWVVRILAGGTFIFSGLAKSIDPWGSLYKIQDYLAAMGLDLWPSLVIVGTFALCALEFIIGIFIVCGCFRRSTPIVMTAVMVFMLGLTLWIAIADPVADCGCFGDAFKISNWATFFKNVVLILLCVWLLKFNTKAACVVKPYFQWLASLATGIYILVVAFAGYYYQPLVDFRPYKIGETIVDFDSALAEDSAEGLPDFIFVYEKDGVRKEFRSSDELPDEADGWVFVERKEVAPADISGETESSTEGNKRESVQKAFRIWDETGEEDVTPDVAMAEGRQLFLMMPELAKVSIATTWQINSLYTWAGHNNIDMVAVVGGSEKDIERWKDLSLAAYPIYTADDTQIKEVVRGNPALVYTENGKIIWKSSLLALDTDDFLSPDTSSDPRSFAHDNKRILGNFTLIYIAVMAMLALMSYSPWIARLFFRTRSLKQKEEEKKVSKKETAEKEVSQS